MPFDEEDDAPFVPQKGVKEVSSKKSMFDGIPKKPSQESFEKQIKISQDRLSSYKVRASELATQFNKVLSDKVLPENKTIFAKELENELLTKMIQLAIEINNDPDEKEGMGSLGWIVLLFKTCLSQKDRANILEYKLSQIDKRIIALENVDKTPKSG